MSNRTVTGVEYASRMGTAQICNLKDFTPFAAVVTIAILYVLDVTAVTLPRSETPVAAVVLTLGASAVCEYKSDSAGVAVSVAARGSGGGSPCDTMS